MTVYSYKIDLTKVSYAKLLELKERFARIQQHGGGYQDWVKEINTAIENHPDNPNKKATICSPK